ncbi:MAG: DUF448 domain-containing protein [Proteobacteria bacterium]|nr:DUF448 domain-containing protein [Pseudomonadota bacterium]
MSTKTTPLRTCLATGQPQPQSTLLRFVNVGGTPTPDPTRTLPGRGAYLTPTEEAYNAALKRRAFAHKLKTNQPPPPWAQIAALLTNHE